jgi:hypothetical protein
MTLAALRTEHKKSDAGQSRHTDRAIGVDGY